MQERVSLSYGTWVELFSAFLVKCGIYERFTKKLEGRGLSIKRYVSSMKNRPFGMVSQAFTWCVTEEGFVFWDKIDTKWRALVDKLI